MFQWVVFSFDVTTLNLAISVYFQEAIFFFPRLSKQAAFTARAMQVWKASGKRKQSF